MSAATDTTTTQELDLNALLDTVDLVPVSDALRAALNEKKSVKRAANGERANAFKNTGAYRVVARYMERPAFNPERPDDVLFPLPMRAVQAFPEYAAAQRENGKKAATPLQRVTRGMQKAAGMFGKFSPDILNADAIARAVATGDLPSGTDATNTLVFTIRAKRERAANGNGKRAASKKAATV